MTTKTIPEYYNKHDKKLAKQKASMLEADLANNIALVFDMLKPFNTKTGLQRYLTCAKGTRKFKLIHVADKVNIALEQLGVSKRLIGAAQE